MPKLKFQCTVLLPAFILIQLILLLGPQPCLCQTLYADCDDVTDLTRDSFPSHLLGADQVWVVEFYATWCGHCQRFAPVWKEFAANVRGWSKVLRVGAVACSVRRNVRLCQMQQIRSYPTVKIYQAGLQTVSSNDRIQPRRRVSRLVQDALRYLDRQVPLASWPRLQPYGSAAEILTSRQQPTDRVYVIKALPDSQSDAQMAVLDLSYLYPGVIIGRITAAATPGVYRVDDSASLTLLSSEHSRAAAVRTILGDVELYRATTTPALPLATTSYHWTPSDGVHSQDLVSSLYYSLWQEIPTQGVLEGEALQALQDYVHVISKYHPLTGDMTRFLQRVCNWVSGVSGPLPVSQWTQNITRLHRPMGFIPNVTWSGCQGSSPRYRGYPCSLWMTFHTLTVGASRQGNFTEGVRVLRAVRGYVRHFLGCRECARHFWNMSVNMETDIGRRQDPAAPMLWLWRAHNRVNHRLHGDPTEDPGHPKVQFPSYTACPGCYLTPPQGRYDNYSQWNQTHVTQYLQRFYGEVIQD